MPKHDEDDNEIPVDSINKHLEWEEAGSCDVDAGCIWIGDPCYVFPDKKHKDSGYDYSDLLDDWAAQTPKEVRHCTFTKVGKFGHDRKPGGEGRGVCIRSGYGDGNYNVYVKKNNEGRICEARIVFIVDSTDYNTMGTGPLYKTLGEIRNKIWKLHDGVTKELAKAAKKMTVGDPNNISVLAKITAKTNEKIKELEAQAEVIEKAIEEAGD